MNTQTNTEEIDALLRSSDIEDVILGCRIAAEHLGKEWCKEHFQGERDYIFDTENYQNYCLLEFDEFYIWIGTQWIQYYSSYLAAMDVMSDPASLNDPNHFKSFTTNT